MTQALALLSLYILLPNIWASTRLGFLGCRPRSRTPISSATSPPYILYHRWTSCDITLRMSINEAAAEVEAVAALLRKGLMSLAVLLAAADPAWN
jgi:hypothetical protein